MSGLIVPTALPGEGYIIQMPYDEEVGTIVLISIIPYADFDRQTIDKYKDNIILTKTRLPGEDDFDFKKRLEEIIEKIKRQRGSA